MAGRARRLARVAFSALYYTRAHTMLSSWTGGVGLIFALHHVRPEEPGVLEANRSMRITPQFLEAVIRLVRDTGIDVISLDEMHVRLVEGDFRRRFACFTFDDGYKDNLEFAYPIFRRHNLPFAIYVPTDYPDGLGDLWWLKLEMVIAAVEALELRIEGLPTRLEAATPAQKDEAFGRVYWWLRSIPEGEARRIVADLCDLHGIDAAGLCRELIMTWGELRDLAGDHLVTLGAHTRRHLALAKLTIGEARLEMEESIRRLEREVGRPVRHFSFPYGDETSAGEREFELARELGLDTAVTTRKGLIHAHHALAPTGLPRVSLNGDFQSTRYVKVMLTGAPFAFWNAAQRLRPGSIAARVTGRHRPLLADTSSSG